MEVTVEHARGIPEGSILSIRAGNVRRQGTLPTDKPVRFASTSPLDACPFKVDVFSPLGSSRLVLKPRTERYSVILGDSMELDLLVKEAAEEAAETPTESRQARKQKAMSETQAYIEEHEIVRFVQNLMAGVLAEKPADPYAYMESHLAKMRAVPKEPKKAVRVPSKKQATVFLPAKAKVFEGPAFVREDANGRFAELSPLLKRHLMHEKAEVLRLKTPVLQGSRGFDSPLSGMLKCCKDANSYVTQTLSLQGRGRSYQMLQAGPRSKLHFNPSDVVATVVTCGGLCPGLNAVVRELVMTLYMYGAKKIWGIKGGYKGVVKPAEWVELTPETVQDIHNLGGTILVSDRGNPTEEEQARHLMAMGVRQHFIIGGDGTHKGAYDMHEKMRELNYECSVVGIPKTIDNDIPMLDRTFGFDTACTEAKKAIDAAYVESTCNANCIGLVKLMGRHCGFIAQNACLAARNVDIVLLPEMEISLPKVLEHCLQLMQTKGHAVIVVAEGCGDTLLKSSGERDAGGNVKLADVGPWLRDKITERFKEVKLPLTIKYIDPTYMIRAVMPNANDSVYCSVLAQNAVHAAMAGSTGVTSAQVQQQFVILPIQCVTKLPLKRVDLKGRWFMELVSTTLQPDFAPDDFEAPPAPAADPKALEDCTELLEEVKQFVAPCAEVRRLDVEHLRESFGERHFPTTLHEKVKGGNLGFVDEGSWVSQTISGEGVKLQMHKAGPQRTLYFAPEDVAATIVTCGGLCPGLNSVIREIVMMLYAYGVKKVYGIKGGFKGVASPSSWLTLTPENVKDIHKQGGSILVSDRGNPPHAEMAKVLQKKGVRQHFVLGGDGTQKGAYQTYEQMQNIGWECAVVGIPKTIDNDINLLDRSFGFDTAMTEAENAIDTAYVEATCNANAIGLVKLMGRHCGYLTMMASLAARHVDICLLPEMDISVEKVLDHCVDLLSKQGYAVVVVGEGCGDTLMSGTGEVDDGGNKKMSDVGPWLKDQITAHFKGLHLPITIKYVDPTYMVRAVPANANDSIYCSVLAQAAVHTAMAGYTGVTVGKVNSSVVHLPIKMITSLPSRVVDLNGPWFERLLATTGQPNLEKAGMMLAKPIDPRQATVRTPFASGVKPRRGSLILAHEEDEVRVPETSLKVIGGYGKDVETRPIKRDDILFATDEIRELSCFHLSERYGTFKIPSTLKGFQFCDSFSWTTQAMFLGDRVDSGKGNPYYKMIRAGAREHLHFDPYDPASCAAIVSCGGICPGLNSVIREIVMTLWDYGVRRIYGIKGGYKGVVEPENWIVLTPEVVKDIHESGGTMLISDRGNPDHAEMAKTLQEKGVRQYFVLGGDGTHKGAMQTFDSCLSIDHECAVIGVPKTIDNDVPMFDQTFGFDTACTEAVKAVDSAYVEARCNANCIGLVKLMGRHCGFIAMNAALAARHVDICLLPEMDVDLEKVLAHAESLMRTRGYAVIVVAEGCGDTLIQSSGAIDAGGNKVLSDVGPWLKDTITSRCKEKGIPVTIKYIDPTYMIRSVPANSFDSAYCSVLGQMAVHGAMAGYSGVTVGKVYERYVYLPIHAITMQKGKRVNPKGRWFNRMVETTKQPDFSPSMPSRPGSSAGPKAADVLEALSTPSSINRLLQPGDEFHRFQVANLAEKFASRKVKNPVQEEHSKVFLNESSWSTQTLMRANRRDDRGHVYFQLLRSGPRDTLHFEPASSAAVIVTCGGLCPGLNSVIRELVMTLANYGVPKIYGCIGGYKGMVQPEKWQELTPEYVQSIHQQGGTILVSDRGNPEHMEIAKTLQKMKITQYFVIGGDGTQAGAMDSFKCCQEINHEIAVVGVPKTIDNDIPVLDRSFGFNTACSEAEKAISCAYVEASSNTNCIGLVKLMGRHCGFIAMHATLSARSVDICLLPEMDVSLPKVFTHAMKLMKKQGHAVIVVAEGCGDTLLKSSGERDAGGNKKLADVGPWLKEQLLGYFKKMQQPLTIKYIDPTYTVRAVPANANDQVYCSVLAQHAVHGAMAGYTGTIVGKVDERYVMLPMHQITKMKTRKVDLKSRPYERMLATTGQPDLSPGLGDDWLLLPKPPTPAQEQTAEVSYPPPMSISDWRQLPKGGGEDAAEMPGATLKVVDGYGEVREERSLKREDLMQQGGEVRKLEVISLGDKYPSRQVKSPLSTESFLDDDSWAMEAMSSTGRVDSGGGRPYYQMLSAGPRETLHFDPKDLTTAIVTCGGLCPGENTAVRAVFQMLQAYGVSTVYGIQDGFQGFLRDSSWSLLSAEMVQEIHFKGGTILKSDRGHPPHLSMAEALKKKKVKQLFVLGGEGAHKGITQLCSCLKQIEHECAVVGLPSTVDNDIPMVDVSFGFETACSEAKKAIDAAYVEAKCNANCIGYVKLLGQHSGLLAMKSTLASRHVDICLLTEMEISLEKVLDHCEALMSSKGYAVVVVTDGCGASLFKNAGERPENGDVGPWLKEKIMERFSQKGKALTIKYIDPTYMVRSVKANAYDSVYCSSLAEHAVHGAMAGFSCITTAKIHERYCYLPVQVVCAMQKRVNCKGRWFGRMLYTTKQPNFEPEGFVYPPEEDDKELLMANSTPVRFTRVLPEGAEITRLECVTLTERFEGRKLENPTIASLGASCVQGGSWTTQTFFRGEKKYLQMQRSGPHRTIHFDPKEASAAIVTCGGLCPGLNDVIREIVKMLHQYGVEKVYGIIGGFKGAVKDEEWRELTDEYVQDIHTTGGSILVSDRGNPPHSEIAKTLAKKNVRQYFVLGGDGTHKGAMESFQAMTEINHECAVVGVPKTIDNDIQLLDRTFGFDTACEAAREAIDSAYVEATTNANCIGLVKLMGRHCGWIAATAALAAGHVDVCLIPEMDISLPKLLDHISEVMQRQGHMVIVVAEGCGDTIIASAGGTDAGGNKVLADVGPFLKEQITSHCKKKNMPVAIKYIDPTYMVRAVPANAYDSIYCSVLAQMAVHSAMAGYTGITVGKVDERFVALPIHSIVDRGARTVSLTGFTYQRLVATTRQPSFAA